MLEESKKMVEDSRKRLGNALQELRSLVVSDSLKALAISQVNTIFIRNTETSEG
jgi:hypothetical protein